MKSFNNKVAAITGAASGMGRTLALQLARDGCHLALADRNEAALAQTLHLVRAHEGDRIRVTTHAVDVADRAAVYRWAEEANAVHGKVNLIFNNAGVALSSTIEGMDDDELAWIMNINFWGVVHGTKAFLPLIKATGDGHIVNTSSIFGIFAQPGMGAYNASKYAVRGYTEALRQELDMMNCGVSATCVHRHQDQHRQVEPHIAEHEWLPGARRTAGQGRVREVLHHVAGEGRTGDPRWRAQEQAPRANRPRRPCR